MIAFLQRSAAALKPGGVLFVKENVCEKGFIVDSSDASVTRCSLAAAWMPTLFSFFQADIPARWHCRSHQYYVQLFERAGLRLAHTALQKDFPKGLFKGKQANHESRVAFGAFKFELINICPLPRLLQSACTLW